MSARLRLAVNPELRMLFGLALDEHLFRNVYGL